MKLLPPSSAQPHSPHSCTDLGRLVPFLWLVCHTLPLRCSHVCPALFASCFPKTTQPPVQPLREPSQLTGVSAASGLCSCCGSTEQFVFSLLCGSNSREVNMGLGILGTTRQPAMGCLEVAGRRSANSAACLAAPSSAWFYPSPWLVGCRSSLQPPWSPALVV